MTAAKLAGLFALVVVVVVGGAAAVPFVAGSGGTTYAPVENEQFRPGAIVADESPENGEITMNSTASDKTVLIDAGHANDYAESDIQPLVTTLTRNGHTVEFYRGQDQRLNESLRGADAFVVANPRRPFGPGEVDGVRAFARAGGRVLLLGDPPSTGAAGGLLLGGVERTAYRQTDVASPLGVGFDAGYLYNMEHNDANYRSVYATPSASSDLTRGVDRVVVRDAAPVLTADGSTVLVGTAGTTLSTTRRSGEYAVAVRRGDVVAVGDTDFLAPEDVYAADNEVLVGNLADFLVSGDRRPGVPGAPDDGDDRPTRPPASGPQSTATAPR
jgi:hypothetical protein